MKTVNNTINDHSYEDAVNNMINITAMKTLSTT